jgi:hypothetical protein
MFARTIHEVVRLSVHYYMWKTVTLEIHDVSMWHPSTKLPALYSTFLCEKTTTAHSILDNIEYNGTRKIAGYWKESHN